jgi:hypothetical protein
VVAEHIAETDMTAEIHSSELLLLSVADVAVAAA